MNVLTAFKNLFGKPLEATRPIAPLNPEPEPDEIRVPEISAAALREALDSETPPLLLDVREPYEWRQVRIPGAVHIPMNNVPQQLGVLSQAQQIVVFCAHGSRSFGVTHFLREQGYDAYNLTGGITQWHIQGGEIEMRTSYTGT